MSWPFLFSARTLVKYILLQVPGTLLVLVLLLVARQLFSLPSWAFWTLLLVWVVKDIALFPLVWKSYDASPGDLPDGMIGERGLVRDRLGPCGYILVRGELWRAELMEEAGSLEAGSEVLVIGRKGLTLLVRPDILSITDREEKEASRHCQSK